MNSALSDAQGRLDHGPPIAVVDIGSNSVRLVVYEGLTRSPTELFNEKALCGLGREVQTTRLLAADAVQHALATLRRFRALCDTMGVKKTFAIATAACRDAAVFVKDRQPDRRLVGSRPIHPVFPVSRNIHGIPRLKLDHVILESKTSRSAQHHHPLVLWLVVPEIGRRSVTA